MTCNLKFHSEKSISSSRHVRCCCCCVNFLQKAGVEIKKNNILRSQQFTFHNHHNHSFNSLRHKLFGRRILSIDTHPCECSFWSSTNMDDLLSPKSSTRKTISGISHYIFLKTVGQGQFGKVKLAVHQITKDKVRSRQSSDLKGIAMSRLWKKLVTSLKKSLTYYYNLGHFSNFPIELSRFVSTL